MTEGLWEPVRDQKMCLSFEGHGRERSHPMWLLSLYKHCSRYVNLDLLPTVVNTELTCESF